MSRKPLLAGNWKMFKTSIEARKFFEELIPLISPSKGDREVAFGVPFPSLEASVVAVGSAPITICAQNLHWEAEGAFTGEVSGAMIKATGAGGVIIGHSERRQMFGDTGETVNKKLRAALEAGLVPLVCIGETQQEREAKQTFSVLETQLKEALTGFNPDRLGSLIVAYEPVWAIGTGLSATPDQAQEVHAFLRKMLAVISGPELAQQTRLLYGGSVKPDNVAHLMTQPDIDGALVGGASLQASTFAQIINYKN